MLKWLWCLVRVDAFQIVVARLCHYPLLWGRSFRREICLDQTCETFHLYSSCGTEKSWPNREYFIKRGRDLSRYNKRVDNNNRLTANTAHIVEARHDYAGNGPLCVSTCSQKQYQPVWCGSLRHSCWTSKVCREFSSNQTEADGA